ncbi:hypothetical protein GCM10009612_69740 [Streptomyces beijiangensis]
MWKVLLGLKRKSRISADDGAGKPGLPLGYADKELKCSKGWLAAMTGYEAFDREKRLLDSFGVQMKKSLDRTT